MTELPSETKRLEDEEEWRRPRTGIRRAMAMAASKCSRARWEKESVCEEEERMRPFCAWVEKSRQTDWDDYSRRWLRCDFVHVVALGWAALVTPRALT
jgi:hypothetical protein